MATTKRLTALLVAVFTLLALSVHAYAQYAISTYLKHKHDGLSPPQVIGGQTLQVGQQARVQIPPDHFNWTSGTPYFTQTDLDNFFTEVIALPGSNFSAPQMEVVDGNLYVTAVAERSGSTILGFHLRQDLTVWNQAVYDGMKIEIPYTVTPRTAQSTDGLVITGLNPQFSLGNAVNAVLSGGVYENNNYRVPLQARTFLWSDGADQVIPSDTAAVQYSQLTEAQVQVDAFISEHAQIISDVSLQGNATGSYMELETVEKVVSINDVPFEFSVVLRCKGTVLEGDATSVLRIPVHHVSAGTSRLDISDGTILHADADISSIRLSIGEGVELQTSLAQGERSCAVAEKVVGAGARSLSSADIEYRLYHQGLSDTMTTVTFGQENPDLYVYDVKGNYLGKPDEPLALRDIYYISPVAPNLSSSSKRASGGTTRADTYPNSKSSEATILDAVVNSAQITYDRPQEIPNDPDSVDPNNPNDNPSTGAI